MFESIGTFRFRARAAFTLPDPTRGEEGIATRDYVVSATFRGKSLGSNGRLPGADLAPLRHFCMQQWAGKVLNTVLPMFSPTPEHLAKHLFDAYRDQLPALVAVGVSDDDGESWSTYYEEGRK